VGVHEGVPGHFFQLSLSRRNSDPIRRQYYDSSANEGIAFYAEEMMLDAGLYDDSPRSREIIYNFARLRALRVEVDVKLALGQFSIAQAADYLARSSELVEPRSMISRPVGSVLMKHDVLNFLSETNIRQPNTALSDP
jgi:uncharacterized protein (DUF885 family)